VDEADWLSDGAAADLSDGGSSAALSVTVAAAAFVRPPPLAAVDDLSAVCGPQERGRRLLPLKPIAVEPQQQQQPALIVAMAGRAQICHPHATLTALHRAHASAVRMRPK